MFVYIVLIAMAVIVVGFAHYSRNHARELVQRTRRFYAVSAPAAELPSVKSLCHGLEGHGYQMKIWSEGTAVKDGADSVRAILNDTRHPDGRLHLALTRRGDRIDGEIESEDSGPEFYEEMARYAILVLSDKIPELEYTRPGGDMSMAETLAEELPEEPLGLSL